MRIAASFLLLHLVGCGLGAPPQVGTSEVSEEIEADNSAAVDDADDADVTVTGGVDNQAGSTVGGPGPIPHPNI